MVDHNRNTFGKVAVLIALATFVALAVLLLTHRDKSGSEKPRTVVRKQPHKKDGAKPVPSVHSGLSAAVVRNRKLPILMYHVVAKPPANAPLPDLYVTPSDFAAQMGWLKDSGFTGVTQAQAYNYWHGAGKLPSKPIVISFDDGYHSHYSNALPVLRKLDWPAVLNLEVNNLKHQWGLKPRQVRELIDSGWELAAHTVNHPDLTTVGSAQLKSEIAGSRQILKRRFQAAVDFFCYPAGRFNDTVVEAVRAAGFKGATTTEPGLANPSDPFRMARVRINGSDGLAGFKAKMVVG